VGAGAAGAGAGAYEMTDFEATVDASPSQLVQATESTFEQMNLSHILVRRTSTEGEVTARTASDRKVTLRFEQETGLTRVWIRVGALGDETMSRDIFEKVRAQI